MDHRVVTDEVAGPQVSEVRPPAARGDDGVRLQRRRANAVVEVEVNTVNRPASFQRLLLEDRPRKPRTPVSMSFIGPSRTRSTFA